MMRSGLLLSCIVLVGIGQTHDALATERRVPPKLEVVAQLNTGPGNVTVTPDGRVILSLHQFYNPDLSVVELMDDGTLRAFPNDAWAGPPDASGTGTTAVLGLRSDGHGIVWMLDNGGGKQPARLIGWDTKADALHRVIDIPPTASVEGSFHNDLALDQERPLAYLADIAGGIVVLNLKTGQARRVLDGHKSTSAEDVDFVVRGEVLRTPSGEHLRVGLNPITISADNAHVFYGAMNGTSLWRVPTAALADPSLSMDALAAQVERYGAKPPSDGITIDDAGNVYVTDGGGNAIGVTQPDGNYEVVIVDQRLEWPDGLATGPDGYIYATVNRLNNTAPLNAGKDEAPLGPYYIVRFRPLADVTVGR